jgi:hypothetical protein
MENKKLIVLLVLSLISLSMVTSAASQSNEKIKDGRDLPNQPEKPTITGSDYTIFGEMCEYEIRSVDPQGDEIYYEIHCTDCPVIFRTDYSYSGETIVFQHCWDNFYQKTGEGKIRARAIDYYGHESEWATFDVEIDLKVKTMQPLFYRFFQNNPLLYQLLTNLMNLIK